MSVKYYTYIPASTYMFECIRVPSRMWVATQYTYVVNICTIDSTIVPIIYIYTHYLNYKKTGVFRMCFKSCGGVSLNILLMFVC